MKWMTYNSLIFDSLYYQTKRTVIRRKVKHKNVPFLNYICQIVDNNSTFYH
jgi:hypothetical protein